MRYGDLVQFEPIETVIQLRSADEKERARKLVRTYVISDHMAERLVRLVIPHLQFTTPHDYRGILIVGNYGTGKSHLMSVLSAVAEHEDLLTEVSHPGVREELRKIAGKFHVVRVEIGAVTRSLRDILLDSLAEALEAWGTPFSFPPADRVAANKDLIIKAVAGFQDRYPEQGILLVVDELLDYLRSRNEQQLMLDFGFLRELGEVVKVAPFRFIGGVQESLFDSPRFAFVAEPLRHVRERFDMLLIAREDIAYVVSHRLLAKRDDQLQAITEHLRRFAPLYESMAERLTEFAALFPVHPAYLETFEAIHVAEKREILKTLSEAIARIIDTEVPQDRPGLIAFDQYWGVLRENPSLRSFPAVSTVIDRSRELEGRIRNAYERPCLLDMALRIIHALSVHRLTTENILTPVGLTARELRDDLCLYVDTPERSAEFLLGQVQVALREIIRTVSGQYISYNRENGQYYLDVQKAVDFDELIRQRGAAMSEDELDRYFFDALRQALNLGETTYVTGYRIWPYELPWYEHQVTRPGYLFLGPPDERSTAQPPRDFYVYVLPPHLKREPNGERQADEVVFRLTGLDADWDERLRAYAGARALSLESPEHRQVYLQKADEHLRRLLGWLREEAVRHLEVTCQGVTEPVAEVLPRLRSSATPGIEELLRVVSAHLLESHFEERYPEYPRFPRQREPISERGREAAALEAVRALAGSVRTQLGTAVLAGLELLDEQGAIRPGRSRYARHFLERLLAKPEGQVLNRGELIEVWAPGMEPVEKEVTFRLEPEWVVVVLLALVYNGDMEIDLGKGVSLDPGNIQQAAHLPMAELVQFRLCRRPRQVPVGLWVSIFELLGLSPGLIRDPNQHEQAVRELQRVVGEETPRLAALEAALAQGLRLWNLPLFTEVRIVSQDGVVTGSEHPEVTLSATDLVPPVRGYKQFLEQLAAFNTPGKLRNLRMGPADIAQATQARDGTRRAEALVRLVHELQPLTSYLAEAQADLPAEHPWSTRAEAVRRNLLSEVRRHGRGEGTRQPADMLRELQELKAGYVAAYAAEHRRLVLTPEADGRRRRLYGDARLKALETLSPIEILNTRDLGRWKQQIGSLLTCRGFHEGAIADTPTCPFCKLRPAQQQGMPEAEQVLRELDRQLDTLLVGWRRALVEALQSERARASLAAMTPAERRPIELFLKQPLDSAEVPEGFVPAAQQALRGLKVIELSAQELIEHLRREGLPCTREELERRFGEYLREQLRGHDPAGTRLTLDA